MKIFAGGLVTTVQAKCFDHIVRNFQKVFATKKISDFLHQTTETK